jgi:hypothetical protein
MMIRMLEAQRRRDVELHHLIAEALDGRRRLSLLLRVFDQEHGQEAIDAAASIDRLPGVLVRADDSNELRAFVL